MKTDYIVGLQFGRLTVTKFSHKTARQPYWECICECGKLKIVRGSHLKSGAIRSCGCLNKEASSKRKIEYWQKLNIDHGMTGTSEYNIYMSARARCQNPNNHAYKNYGARGIQFKFRNFEEFFEHLGPKPSGHSIDRIDNNGHYEPGNVRWASATQQANNKRPMKNQTGFTGVYFCGNKFKANIRISNKTKHLGLFSTVEEAHEAYLKAKETV